MSLTIETRSIGPTQKPLLIAEVSANHDRDLEHSLRLVEIAAETGWDCLKLQTYTAESLTMRSDHPAMRIEAKWGKATLHELYESAAMPMEFHAPLFDRARELGLLPFTSIYDPRDLDFIEALGNAVYKIASFEMTYDDLLHAVAGTGKPVILSTGMATLDEVAHALDVLDAGGAGPVILLHCCSSYPAPASEINLNAMVAMGTRFGRMTGFSDHTIGARAPLAAAAMGAVAIEKHFTNDTARPGPDHRFSATPEVMREIAEGTAEIHLLKGSGLKGTTEAEAVSKAMGRRSAFALRDLPEGTRLAEGDYRFIRPGAGIPANDPAAVAGARLARPVRRGNPITYEDIAS
ncbi:N-acetylneuraminate synthase family protein [Profundibacterium mesophilum]|uniref:N-acetylneuraminate synthase n=1 Tax=Profundibacterium mesophilum KAUST100406-0324 TaxID=1037889 RepID=A0A921NX34_9RHOB|nr:N-acetylneuraminate synthase family protein [Profundibacterium mesophilum]KAF0677020.1 N-acetylneuraminate synthase [Profundibacterium mesophilum KAUST100406-0324]